MILKGSARSGGADLALHLMNAFDNERIELGQVRGTVAEDLHGAFGEHEAIAAGTRCKKPLYSLSINPSAKLTRDQYLAAIDRIEKGLGLSGQPRAVVFHVKNGREHCHVVWSRIDARTMKAVHLSHDRMKLRALSRELAREFGLKLPEGLERDKGERRGQRQEMSLAEKRQAEQTGITPEKRRREITKAWQASDSAEAFRAALSQKGYILAKGDKRGFVVIDRYGHVHSLARQIKGVKTRDLKTKLTPLADQLPTVDQARVLQREHRKTEDDAIRARVKRRVAESMRPLQARQAARRAALDQHEQRMLLTQASERLALSAAQLAERKNAFTGAAMLVFALLERIPALRSVLAPILRNPNLNPNERHARSREALARRHAREKALAERRKDFLHQLEAREMRSLRNDLTRRLRVEERVRAQKAAERSDQFVANKKDITEPTLGADAARARSGKDAWKQRQDKLSQQHGVKQTRRPPGYKYKRDDPS
jgi:hypothetical protein